MFEELGAHLASGPDRCGRPSRAPLVDGVADGDGAGRRRGRSPSGGGRPVVVEHADESDVLLVLHDDRVGAARPTDLPAPIDGSPLDPLTPVAVFAAVPDGEVVGGPAEARRAAAGRDRC